MKKPHTHPNRRAQKAGLAALLVGGFSGLGFLVCWLRHPAIGTALSDALFMLGLFVEMAGILMCLKGAPNVFSWLAGRTTRPKKEQRTPAYPKDFSKNSVLEFTLWRTVVLLTGAVFIACAVLVAPM